MLKHITTLLLCFIVCYMYQENAELKAENESLARSRETLSWLAKHHAPMRDFYEVAGPELEYLRFRGSATEIMHPEWVEILNATYKYSCKFNIPAAIILSVIHRESNFRLGAASPVAYGLMQIHYAVWRDELNLDFNRLISDVDYNIMHGCIILKQYYNMTGDWADALLLYNSGFARTNLKYVPRVMSSKFYGGLK